MLKIKFRYKDTFTRGEWATQQCVCSSVEDCKKFYGLDDDPTIEAYEILEVVEAERQTRYGEER